MVPGPPGEWPKRERAGRWQATDDVAYFSRVNYVFRLQDDLLLRSTQALVEVLQWRPRTHVAISSSTPSAATSILFGPADVHLLDGLTPSIPLARCAF